MGSIISMITEDTEFYKYLCETYNEKQQILYSTHHRWLEDKHRGKTTTSFEKYQLEREIKDLENQIKNSKQEIQRIETELNKTQIKLNEKLNTKALFIT